MKNFIVLIFAFALFSSVMTAGVVEDVGDRVYETENVLSADILAVDFEIVAGIDLSQEAVQVETINLHYAFYQNVEKESGTLTENPINRYLETDYQPDTKRLPNNYKETNPENLRYLHRLTHSLRC